MRRPKYERSIVVRLVRGFVCGALAIALGLGFLELRRAEILLQAEITRHVARQARIAQSWLRRQSQPPSPETWRLAWPEDLTDPLIAAVRLRLPDGEHLTFGNWPDLEKGQAVRRRLGEADAPGDIELDLSRTTIVRAPLVRGESAYSLEMLIDGPAARQARRFQALGDLGSLWLLLALLTMLGLLLLRRWMAGPLAGLLELIAHRGGAESFYRLARRSPREFSQVAQAVGGMLTRLDNLAGRLRERDQAWAYMHEFAPAALLRLDAAGRIIEANQRAVEWFARAAERDLIGLRMFDLIVSQDRQQLQRAIDRLELDQAARCSLRLSAAGRTMHVDVECVGVRDEGGAIQSVRLFLLDKSDVAALQSDLADKARLLELVMANVADAILWVDASGRIAAANRQLGALLRCRSAGLVGRRYVPEQLWQPLGVVDHELFVRRLAAIDADATATTQERVEAPGGSFLFQSIAVANSPGVSGGRLWIVRDVTSGRAQAA